MKPKPDELLRNVPLFAGLSRKELREVSRLTARMQLPAGRTLIRQGAQGHEFIVVLEGSVDVLIDGEVVARPAAGECYGEVALLDHAPRMATVVATSDVIVDIISQPDFADLLELHPQIEERVREALAWYHEHPRQHPPR
ncbi:cyclic nucleotide-binding domain-containing protein [Aquihabitans sp. McL0605]|uniref:cyclic nucleotide-binding domain-containing protein n=1 Tax=Aquihabitans sp. McL0605 TaxID=3415671 RepID=UPI003CFB99CA